MLPKPKPRGKQKDQIVPTEPPLFRELERLGLVIPMSKKALDDKPKRKKQR